MWRRVVLIALFTLLCGVVSAQEYGRGFIYNGPEEESPNKMIVVDTTLFRLPLINFIDLYGESTRYYRAPTAQRRRGLYYTTAEKIVAPSTTYFRFLQQPYASTGVTLYAAQSGYSVGGRFDIARYYREWSLSGQIYARSGRDFFVDGVFTNSIWPEFTLSRFYPGGKNLEIKASMDYSMRGVQYSSTAEAYALTGSNYYNPSWGFYDGRVRNSRVRRNFNPTLSLYYETPLSGATALVLETDFEYSRRANSSLGWYNALSPMPDYYRYMPSYFDQGGVKDYITDIWRTNDQNYTQIDWARLEKINSLSSDGSAFYVVEDRVERNATWHAYAVANTELFRFSLTYGIEAKFDVNRNFKQMRDLLGADYLYDYDVFMGDSYNKTLPLQNDLATPDRKIAEGDRFGYDYNIFHSSLDAILHMQYRADRFDFNIESTVGAENFTRKGHYEKERFSGAASLGESPLIALNPYTVRASLGYAYIHNQYYSLNFVSSRLSPLSRNLFLNAQNSNFLSPTLCGEQISSVAFAFRYTGSLVMLSGEVYALRSRDGVSVYSLYDDLTSSMARASITNIGYSSYGIEVSADWFFDDRWRISTSLAAGRYYYDSNPQVELYSDYDLTPFSEGVAAQMKGVNIGNAPQVLATASVAYFGVKKYIFNLSTSLASLRYEQPSMVRRSERLLDQAFISPESQAAALKQQSLGSIYDVEVSAMRFFWGENDDRFTVRVSVSNLLGQLSRITYAKESDRIRLQSVNGYFSGSSLREGVLQYGAPRTIKLSVGYKF